ncbi:MAG: hypothetical protein ABI266_02250 [Ginsengibacter sp.]
MKTFLTTAVFFLILLLFSQCNRTGDAAADNSKDLGQSMDDMKMYHDNLGTELRNGDADNASWLLEGMDSSLQVIAATFKHHRKLTAPFEMSYQKKLLPAIKDIRKSLEQHNFPDAVKAYRLLTNNCNSCHKEHDIDEEVLDLTEPANN